MIALTNLFQTLIIEATALNFCKSESILLKLQLANLEVFFKIFIASGTFIQSVSNSSLTHLIRFFLLTLATWIIRAIYCVQQNGFSCLLQLLQ